MSVSYQYETIRYPERKVSIFFHWLARILLGESFHVSGILKLQDPMAFLDDLRSFQMLGDPWAAWVAVTLPWLEILCALGVLTGIGGRGAVWLLVCSLFVFLVAISTAWARGLQLECGCFGTLDMGSSYYWMIFRNLVLITLGVFLLVQIKSGRRQKRSFYA